MEKHLINLGAKPISKEEVEAMLQKEDDEKRAGPGKKAAKREAASKKEQPAAKKGKKDTSPAPGLITNFFKAKGEAVDPSRGSYPWQEPAQAPSPAPKASRSPHQQSSGRASFHTDLRQCQM